jgi:pyruvate dehydrogenase E2 component (dihydrolipoamide acetyltransferase)
MVDKVVMPRLSLTMKEGTIGKWYKKEGDKVQKGEPLVEVVSEKATYDLEAPASGILRKILAQEGVDIPVNAILAVVTAPGETYSETETSIGESQHADVEQGERVLASPAAKRLAREYGINLSTVKGGGPEGRITEEDVKLVIGGRTEVSPRVKQTVHLGGFRRTSAERLSRSFRTAPHSTVMMEVDVSKAAEIHEKNQISFTAIVVNAVAKALTEHSIMNSTLKDDQITVFEDINVGVAVATDLGLVVPVIHKVNEKTIRDIDTTIKQLSEKARQGKLTQEEVTGGTFTVTNLGMYGVDFFTPIINPPEAAILGVGRTVEKPVAINGKIEVKAMATFSLSYDHRIVDGAPAGKFLLSVKERIERSVIED